MALIKNAHGKRAKFLIFWKGFRLFLPYRKFFSKFLGKFNLIKFIPKQEINAAKVRKSKPSKKPLLSNDRKTHSGSCFALNSIYIREILFL